MDSERKIHIIIPAFNAEKFLNKCIDSILNQTYENFDIYIIDDGSTDSSLEIIKSYKDERIKIFSKENGGVSSARNYGIKRIPNTGYMAFIDADDWIGPKYLEMLITSIGDSDLAIATSNKVHDNKISIVVSQILNESSQGPYQKLFKASIGKNILFDETLYVGEDYEYNIRLFDACNSFKTISWSILEYKFGSNPESLTRRKINIKRIFDTFFGWFNVYTFLADKNFYDDSKLKNVLLNKICSEYLQFYGYYKKSCGYKIKEFKHIVSTFKNRKLLKQFKPKQLKIKLKKFIFLYIRPLYKLFYILKKKKIIY